MLQVDRRFFFVVFILPLLFPVGVLFFRFAVFPLGDRPGRACFVLFVLLRCVRRCWIVSAFVASSVVASFVVLLGLFTPIYIIVGIMWRAAVVFIVSENYFFPVLFPVRVIYTSCKKGRFYVVYGFSFSVQYMECIKFIHFPKKSREITTFQA